MPNDFINDESELGPNWQPISAPPIVPGRPSAPPVSAATPVIPQFLQGTIAPNFQHDAHFVDTEFRTPNAPKFGMMPLGANNAVTSSQITSIIKTAQGVTGLPLLLETNGNKNPNQAILNLVQGTGITITDDAAGNVQINGTGTAIAINKQTGTTYTLQPSDNDTLVTVNNNAGGILTLPSPGGTAPSGNTTGGQVDGSLVQSTFSGNVKLSYQPGASSDLAFIAFGGEGAPLGTPSGWTSLAGSGANNTFVAKQFSGSGLISINQNPGPQYWSACLTGFRSSGATVLTSRVTSSGVFSDGQTLSLSSLTAGNYLVLMFANGAGVETSPLVFSVTDSQGNSWKTAAQTEQFYSIAGPATRVSHAQILTAPIKANGSDTLTLHIQVGVGTTVGGAITVYEVSGLIATGPVSGLPTNWFTYIENTSTATWSVGSLSPIDGISQVIQLPPNTGLLVVTNDAGASYYTDRGVDKNVSFSDVSGMVSLSQGGTGADLSNSGGTNQVVMQSTAGGPLSSGAIDYNNLAGVNKATEYNGQPLVAAGLPSILQQQNKPGDTGNTAPTNLAAVSVAGLVRVSVYLSVTTPGTVSSTLPDSQIIFTDLDSSTVITANVTPGNSGNTTSTFQQATFICSVKSGTIMQFAIGQVTPYATSGATSMVFTYRCRVELLG